MGQKIKDITPLNPKRCRRPSHTILPYPDSQRKRRIETEIEGENNGEIIVRLSKQGVVHRQNAHR
ncbi:uncharacterized protein G2W53_045087 [Senna tora]|uniref:Uncharacterized protein n=1 Tax=Senna tora TaxID=362788 RepID=A0A834SGL7_9FABA|nr:uncharacterized protein G2W53_045087 [Senna tora]